MLVCVIVELRKASVVITKNVAISFSYFVLFLALLPFIGR